MAGKISQSDFMTEFGGQAQAAAAKYANEPARPGIINLPPGIGNGVAQLVDCYFGKGEKGSFWRASGKVISPDAVGGVPVKGLFTSVVVMYNAEDQDKFWGEVTNHLKLLAGEGVLKSGANLAQICELITNKKPYFRFSTSAGKPSAQYPNPRTWENWHGTAGLENYGQPLVTTSAPINTTHNGTANHATDPKPWTEQPKAAVAKSEETKADYSDSEDVDSLIVRAKKKDATAFDKLEAMCLKLEYTKDDVDVASFEEIRTWIMSGKKKDEAEGSGEDAGSEKDPEFVPEAGENATMCTYAPPHPRDEGRRLAPVDCVCVKVNEKKKTMHLASVDDKKKKFTDIAWDDENVEYDT